MTEEKKETQTKPFIIIGSTSQLAKYKFADRALTVYLRNGKTFAGKIRWYDDYAVKLIMPDGSGSITIPIHNILYYECEQFALENEKEGKFAKRVFRGVAKSTNKEKQQLSKYKKDNNLLNFYLSNGNEITGRLNWYIDYIYSIKSEEGNKDYQLIKRHILYYRKIEFPAPKRTDKGTIKMVNTEKGFGFIIYDKGDIFFHRTEVVDNWKDIEPGLEVEFGIGKGKKGEIAVNVKSKK